MKKIVLSMLFAVSLAVVTIAADGAQNPTFASTGECGGGTGPVCRTERECTAWSYDIGWPLRFSRTCASWVESTYYWVLSDGGEGDDPALPPGEDEEEPDPQVPQEG
ncbi:MAG TPA: hypothetical protein VML95_03360 [Longimicrobiales bacterium]|jgi:hypothetical protein|nr:hypothetical protein [Longimicrobiales bacterium]